MAYAIREEVGVMLFGDLPDDATLELKATCWVFDYMVDCAGKGARLVPRVESDDPDPPPINSIGEDVRQVWRDLLDLVEAAPGRARLAHALFQCGGAEGLANARVAVDNYIDAATNWNRAADSDEYLRIAARLARIIVDNNAIQQALSQLLDGAEAALEAQPSEGPGYVLRPLDYAVSDPDCPARVDDLLDQAAAKLADARDRDRALQLVFRRCTDDECRNKVWERRVHNYLTAAEAASGIIQLVHRQDALKVAEKSRIRELKGRAAAALQSTRHEDLELVRIETSAALYLELFDQTRDQMSSGATWQEALLSFAKYGPLSGNYEQNCETVERNRSAAPLASLFRDTVLGPDGLPIYEAISPEDRFDGDLTKWEAHHINGNLRPLAAALHSIPERFGMPEQEALVDFLSQWPSTNPYVIQAVTLALQRYWCGDYEGTVYTATPWIENAIRQVILNANLGIYMLQNIRKPGQYPGLGAMIDLLSGAFTLSHSRYRFLKATLTHPLGFNLRNQLAHGIGLFNSSQAAALVMHTLLTVTLITQKPPTEGGDEEPSGEERHDEPVSR